MAGASRSQPTRRLSLAARTAFDGGVGSLGSLVEHPFRCLRMLYVQASGSSVSWFVWVQASC